MNKGINEFDEKVRKESNNKQLNFKFCPSCGSLNLKPVIYGIGKASAALSPQMKCINCGFYGFILEGTPESIKEFKEELKNKK